MLTGTTLRVRWQLIGWAVCWSSVCVEAMLPAHWHCSQISTVSSIKHNRKVNASGYIEDFAVAVFSSLWQYEHRVFLSLGTLHKWITMLRLEVLTGISVLEEWKRPPGRRRITGMRTVLDNFESHYVTLTEGVNVA